MPRRSRASLEIVRPQTTTDRPRLPFDLPYRQSTRLAVNLLHVGLRSRKLAREAKEAFEAAGLTVLDRDGQIPRPPLSVNRDHRAGWLAAIKALELEL
jgi:hypothetical protein